MTFLGVSGWESQPQQALFVAAAVRRRVHAVRKVQEWGGCDTAIGMQDADQPVLLHHEQPPAAIARVGDVDRALESIGHGLELDLGKAGSQQCLRVGPCGFVHGAGQRAGSNGYQRQQQ